MIVKGLPTGFAEEAEAMDSRQLRDCVVDCERNIDEAVRGMEDNEQFQALKTAYKEACAPLREVKKAQRAKIALCLALLEERGN